jgi:hypothetical protein
MILPDGGRGVGAVAARGHADRQQHEAAMRHRRRERFGDAELVRVDEVVRQVDAAHRDGDAIELRARGTSG